MKNKFIVIFAFYFLFTSLGIVYGTHSCGKKFSNTVWGINLSNSKACICKHDTDLKHKKNCCKSTQKWIKAKTDESKQQISLKLSNVDLSIPHYNNNLVFLLFASNYSVFKVSHSPPLQTTPSFIKFRSLII